MTLDSTKTDAYDKVREQGGGEGSPMSDEIMIIETFGEPIDMRHQYVRLDDYMAMTSRAEKAENEKLRAELDRLTKGQQLASGLYKPSRLEELQSDSEERDYWQQQATEARAENERLRLALESIASHLCYHCSDEAKEALQAPESETSK